MSEIVTFPKMPTLFLRFSLYHLLSVSYLLTTVHWIVIGFYPSKIAVLLVAQLLHALSFGVIYAVVIEFAKIRFGRARRAKAKRYIQRVVLVLALL